MRQMCKGGLQLDSHHRYSGFFPLFLFVNGFSLAGLFVACGLQNPSALAPNLGHSRSPELASEEGVLAQRRAIEAVKKQNTSLPHNEHHEFKAMDLIVDPDGAEHTRFERSYKGLQIVGGDFVTHVAGDSATAHIDAASKSKIDLDTKTKVDVEEAKKIARAGFKGKPGEVMSSALVVFNIDSPPTVAWEILHNGESEPNMPSEQKIFVDANTGKILKSWDTVYTVAATGNSYYLGSVPLDVVLSGGTYELKDPTRGNLRTTNMANAKDVVGTPYNFGTAITSTSNIFGSSALTNIVTVAVDVQYGAAATWDYFLKVHNRNGIRNDGIGNVSRAHYDTALNNAFWSDACFCMTYGDGNGTVFGPVVSLDVAGHEMTHGITSNTAKLVYSGESGGLNEATSDIFASMLEYYVNNAKDTPDYIIGEKIVIGKPGVRFMYQPDLDGKSKNCWDSTISGLDVHYSSGIGNHFYYLLAEGSEPAAPLPKSPTCDNSTIVGIGRDKAAKIWYRALTVYMTSTTNYAAARFATLRASRDLYGMNSVETKRVNDAWKAVSVLNIATPSISTVVDQTVDEDTSEKVVNFTIADADSLVSCTDSVTAKSDNTLLLPGASLVLSGTGTNCVLTMKPVPNGNGNAVVTLTVSDSQLSSASSFKLTVNAVNDAPEIVDVAPSPSVLLGNNASFKIKIADIDSTLSCAAAIKTTAANPMQLPNDSFTVSGTAPDCIVTVATAKSVAGSIKINLVVSDGTLSANKEITLVVDEVVASIEASAIQAKAPAWIRFDGSKSQTASAGGLDSYEWNFGDETSGKSKNFWKPYTVPGSYTVLLRVTDKSGHTATQTLQIQIE